MNPFCDMVREAPSSSSSSKSVWGAYRPWDNQKIALESCLRLERRPFKCRDKRTEKYAGVHPQYMRASVGVLALKPGCGKTLVISALVQSYSKADASPDDLAALDPFRLTKIGGNVASVPIKFGQREFVKVLDTTLVVVNSVLGVQWRNTLVKAGVPESRVHLCMGRVAKNLDVAGIVSGKYKVVVVSNFVYRKLMDGVCKACDDPCELAFWRIVIDEADSLPIPNFLVAPTRFLWVVTGTPEGLGKLKWLATIVGQIKQHSNKLFVTGSASTSLPDVEYTHIMPVYKNIADLVNIINIKTLVHFQKKVCDRSHPPPMLLIRNAASEKVMANHCCVTLGCKSELSDLVSMHCCSAVASGKYLARYVEVQKRIRCAPLCMMCGSILGPALVSQLPAPIDEEEYFRLYESIHPTIATHNVLSTLMEEAAAKGRSGVRPRIIIFKESSPDAEEIATLRHLVMAQEYQVLTINQYTQLDKTLEAFARGGSILVLNSDHAQGINIPTGDVIIVTHTVKPEIFRQLVCRAHRHPRTEVVRVFHMQLHPISSN